jgi:hypothetical protein
MFVEMDSSKLNNYSAKTPHEPAISTTMALLGIIPKKRFRIFYFGANQVF